MVASQKSSASIDVANEINQGEAVLAHLVVENVTKRFGSVVAMDGMSFEVAKGEFFALLGPSSAGKTTTLRAIAGLEALQGGSIVFDGQDMSGAAVQNRGMAMIFQTFALYPHLTIRQNFAYPLKRTGVASKDIKQRVGETAELLRVVHTLDRKPPTLSGGEQQRVAIGRAIISRPQLLLLDEPLTNLDAKLRHDMRAEFKRLHRELGMTMLYATPDQLEALTMGQRVGVIKAGRVVEIGEPRSLYAQPGDTYVAGMVGTPPMNFIEGKVQGDRINLPFGEVSAPAAAKSGDNVIFGVRPHDVRMGEIARDGLQLKAKIHLTEPLGDVTILDLDVNGSQLKMVLREEVAATLKVGQTIDVALAGNDGHVFMKETGVRVA